LVTELPPMRSPSSSGFFMKYAATFEPRGGWSTLKVMVSFPPP